MHVIPVVKTNKDDTTRISTGEKRVNVCAAVNLEKHVFNRSYNEMLFVGKINRNQNNRFFLVRFVVYNPRQSTLYPKVI